MITINRIPTINSLTRVHREMNDLFNAVFSSHPVASATFGMGATAPPINVWEDEKAWRVEAELPGYRLEDIEVSVLGSEVTLKGKREIAAHKDASCLRRERSGGTFERTWTLPGDVDAEHVDASLTNGILTLTLPKSPKVLPRKINVRASA
jgi:HSP20 family protein